MDLSHLKEMAQTWLAADPDPNTRDELKALLADPNGEAELVERFGASLEFGTAGLRGTLGAGPNRMNRAVVRRTTAGLARYLRKHVPDVSTRGVVVGRDGRQMSPEFLQDTAEVLAAEGICALVFDRPVPTPLVAFACVHTGAAGAVVITASHNPPEYNGYKVYWENGAQIIPPHDEGIAAAIEEVEPANQVGLLSEKEARAQGLWRDVASSVFRKYLDAISALRIYRKPPKTLRVVYTAMHGVGGHWAVTALREAGFEVAPVAEQQNPDGQFPTVRFPNPEEKGAMDLATALAERWRADVVLANDPDADRLAAMARGADGQLRPFSGNELGVCLGHYILTQAPSKPSQPLVLTTIVSSLQLGAIARHFGALYEETLTGFKWIANRALAREREGATFVFGYEEALGYSVGQVVRDKDGIGAALVFADLAAHCESLGKTLWDYLEDIQRQFGLFVSDQKSFTHPGAAGAGVIREIMEHFRRQPPEEVGAKRVVTTMDCLRGTDVFPPANVIAYVLDDGSRITLRPSGTEPKIKYYFEVKEDIRENESIQAARLRGQTRLSQLEEAFLSLVQGASSE